MQAYCSTNASTKKSNVVNFVPAIHKLIYKQKAPLEKVFDVLATRTEPFDSKGCDTFYHMCLHEPLRPPFFRRVVAHFDAFLTEDDAGPSDGTMSSMISLLVKHGEIELAERYLAQRRAKHVDRPPHFRAFAPLWEHYIHGLLVVHGGVSRPSVAGQFDTAWTFFQEIKAFNTHLAPDTVGPVMVTFAMATIDKDDAMLAKVMAELHALRYQITADEAARWRDRLASSSWTTVSIAEDAMRPTCEACGTALVKLGVTPAEWPQLLETVKTMCMKSSYTPSKRNDASKPMSDATKRAALADFEAWLTRQQAKVKPGKTHYIIDGPNVAYLNQNFVGGAFRFDYIDTVVRAVEAAGHVASITMPSSYFNEVSLLSVKASTATRRLRKEGKLFFRTQTKADKAFLEGWIKHDRVFRCRREVAPDDLFWLYASAFLSLKHENTRVISNDIVRDHIVVLAEQFHLHRDLIDRWKDTALVRIRILDKNLKTEEMQGTTVVDGLSVELIETPPFSRVVQGDHHHVYHLPIAERAEWLCLTRKNTQH
ncbi:Aste57867_8767 [Aphanomyces stellatus]|uniref:Aste57867_8767 protein n=1 Tax=Aphanomyces stellatus TaxID=120398 RepID=A0A485KL95_9STRA|nr:hypothetical protein As57867_008733 [Aphanomyces stellatus]VFT85653.1 Aste57867_8767 [Aphanomyces stellatus]